MAYWDGYKIRAEGHSYATPSAFAKAMLEKYRGERPTKQSNGWNDVNAHKNDRWVTLASLR
jgi:hypothetical protein